ncbi:MULTISPECIES: hypothetical protein [Paenibacillus]|uniref:Uncharacterized protein n=1 Tax=Paenibacillus alvei TaxID=44250 RepID=A0ABT4ED79_PAEAL|nr:MULTISPECIES: hypothetical protein [Paenibacillus]MCY9531692.1 hypothetical protein [Paenibacillus alvei]
MSLLTILAELGLRILFRTTAPLSCTEDEERGYKRAYQEALDGDGIVRLAPSLSKERFVRYIVTAENVLVHGSNHQEINELLTKQQTLYNGIMTEAVFATSDGIWAMFYAVLDRAKLKINFRNGCVISLRNKRFYFFSLTRETFEDTNYPWRSGTIYLLSKDTFNGPEQKVAAFDEWTSCTSVKPLARIHVEPSDFIFLDHVATHKSTESAVWTWLLYKWRSRARKRMQSTPQV